MEDLLGSTAKEKFLAGFCSSQILVMSLFESVPAIDGAPKLGAASSSLGAYRRDRHAVIPEPARHGDGSGDPEGVGDPTPDIVARAILEHLELIDGHG
jgi:hypothetical protein